MQRAASGSVASSAQSVTGVLRKACGGSSGARGGGRVAFTDGSPARAAGDSSGNSGASNLNQIVPAEQAGGRRGGKRGARGKGEAQWVPGGLSAREEQARERSGLLPSSTPESPSSSLGASPDNERGLISSAEEIKAGCSPLRSKHARACMPRSMLRAPKDAGYSAV